MNIKFSAKELNDKLMEIRKHLHANPEVSQNENNTKQYIIDCINKVVTNKQIIEVGKTGVLVKFDSGKPGKILLLRADTDALPIQETNNFSHKSTVDGVSHKCGHDGHTAIMIGVTHLLAKYPIDSGKVFLLFQPAEENGEGAKKVLADDAFPKENIDMVFALHNLPGFPKNKVVTKPGPFTANVTSIIIKLNGKTAHAAEPEQGFNPATCMANILHFADKETNNNPHQDNFFLITPIHLNMGEKAYGISAGYGEVHLTIRSWSPQLMKQKCNALVTYIKEQAEKFHLSPDISWTQEFHANINNEEAVHEIEKAARINNADFDTLPHPFKWGEDFGLFTQKFPGAMFGVGSGENCPALHNPDYDYPDDITETAVTMFTQLVHQNLKK